MVRKNTKKLNFAKKGHMTHSLCISSLIKTSHFLGNFQINQFFYVIKFAKSDYECTMYVHIEKFYP